MLNYSNGGRRAISGASLAQIARRMTPVERAVLAADVVDGRILIQGLTAKSVAHLVGTNQSYMFAALRLSPEHRQAVLNGTRPLVPPRARRQPAAAIDWGAVGDDELVEAVRQIGVDRALNAAAAAEHAST
jgi:hypothetical protein